MSDFFGELIIPPAVYAECITEGKGRPEVARIKQASWLRVVPDDADAREKARLYHWGSALASVALGATVIEKHFILRRADGGVGVCGVRLGVAMGSVWSESLLIATTAMDVGKPK